MTARRTTSTVKGEGLDRLPSGKVRARYRDADGMQRSALFATVEDAKAWRGEQLAALKRGTHVNPSNVAVAEAARAWAAARPHRPSTAARCEVYVRAHLDTTALGARPIGEVKPSEVQAWVTDRSRVLAPSTLRNLYGFLRSVFGAAVEDHVVAASPCTRRIALPKQQRRRVVPLTVAQVAALADAVPDHCRAMVLTQAGLGLRVGELLALHVEDVDFLRREVRIERQLAPAGRAFTDPKTPSSRRTIPLPTMVAEALAGHVRVFPPVDGLLFSSRLGNPYRHDTYGSRVFVPAAKRAGLPAGTTTHDLRHHYASVLIAAGESVVAVAERLGHETAALVLSTYGHLMPDSEDSTRRAVDAAWTSLCHVRVTGSARKAL